MSLDRLCKATGLTLAIVGLSVAHSFAIEESPVSKNLTDSQLKIEVSQSSVSHLVAEGKKLIYDSNAKKITDR